MKTLCELSNLYDRQADLYGKDFRACHYRFRWSFLQRQQVVLKRFSGLKGKQILDVGCGPGLFSAPLAKENQLVGIDLSLEMLKLARPELVPVRGEGALLPFKNHSFDVVLAIEVLQHFGEPAPLLREILRVIKPGGQVVVSSLNKASLLHRVLRGVGGYEGLYFHSLDEIYLLLEKEGGVNFETELLSFPFPWVWSFARGKKGSLPFAASWVLQCKKK